MEFNHAGVGLVGGRLTLLRGGVSAVTLGNVVVAGSVAGMLAAGPRQLESNTFVALALAWTVTTIFGYGLAMPTEQLITRRVGGRDGRGLGGPISTLVAAGILTILTMTILAMTGSVSSGMRPMAPVAIAGVVGWVALVSARGHLAGKNRLHAYAGSLLTEGVTRLSLVAAAFMFPGAAAILLGASVGAPILMAALATYLALHRPSLANGRRVTARLDAEQIHFILVAAGYQVTLNAAPIILAWRLEPAQQSSIGSFVIASSYYRLAAVLGGGFTTATLVSLSRLWANRQHRQFSRRLWRGTLGAGAVVAGATLVAMALGPVAVPLLNGGDPHLAGTIVVALGASTVLATAASVATTGLMAAHRGWVAALCWLTGAAGTVGVLLFVDTLGTLVAAGLVFGPAVALAGAVLTNPRTPVAGIANPASD